MQLPLTLSWEESSHFFSLITFWSANLFLLSLLSLSSSLMSKSKLTLRNCLLSFNVVFYFRFTLCIFMTDSLFFGLIYSIGSSEFLSLYDSSPRDSIKPFDKWFITSCLETLKLLSLFCESFFFSSSILFSMSSSSS